MNRIKSLIRRIKSSEDGKNLLVNFFSLSFLQIAGYIFPFITLPYLSRTIGLERYGDIAFASSLMVYFSTIVDFGFLYSSVRDIARVRDSKSKVSEIYSTVMWSRLLLVIISFSLLCVCIFCVNKFFQIRDLLLISFLQVFGHALFPEWMFQGLEKMKYITVFNLLIKLFFTVAVFIFIKSPEDYLYQPLLMSLGFIFSGVCSLYMINRMGYVWQKPKWSNIKQSLKSNWDLFLNQIVPNLYNSLSSLMLGFFHGSQANGLLDAGNKFNAVVWQFMNVLSRTFFPFLSRRIDKHKMYMRLNFSISIFFSLLLFISAPLIIKLFYPVEFSDAVRVLRILSISIVFISLSNIYGTNYLIVIGEQKLIRDITIVASIIGLCAAVPLVYYFSYIGAAITITLSRGILALLTTVFALKLKKKRCI